MSETAKTHVKGYFNPNTYEILIAISEVNLSIRLGPMQFILDRRTGKKINDPILDKYVGPKMLRPEISDLPVDVVRIPVVAAPVPNNPGYVVGQGHKDATGKWQPPAAAQQPPLPATTASGAPLVSAKMSVQGMTIQEARNRGLIGKPKIVPEDYGADEQDGAPVEGAKIPRIKYSMESKPRAAAAQGAPLPAELTEGVDPKVAPILNSLQQAAAADPERADLGRKAAESAVKAQMGPQGVQQFRQARKAKPTPAAPPAPAAVAPPVQPTRRRVAQVVSPTPHVATPGPVAPPENPLVGGRPEAMPQPNVDEPSPPITEADRQALPIRCAACGDEFKYPSWYARHVKALHRDRLQELLPHEHP